jgi:hypothetical protein
VLRHCEKATRIDDGISDSLVVRNNDVVNRSDPFAVVIVDRMPEDLAFGAPAERDVAQLRNAHAQKG